MIIHDSNINVTDSCSSTTKLLLLLLYTKVHIPGIYYTRYQVYSSVKDRFWERYVEWSSHMYHWKCLRAGSTRIPLASCLLPFLLICFVFLLFLPFLFDFIKSWKTSAVRFRFWTSFVSSYLFLVGTTVCCLHGFGFWCDSFSTWYVPWYV